jgi:hypothetical protein
MSRPGFELADVIARFGKPFAEQCSPNSYQQRVLHALSVCRTAELGGHKEACDCCGKIRVSYNSCRNRHCPKCQASKQAFWADDLLQATLPVKHYHMVFTVPHGLNSLAMLDSSGFYRLLFDAVWQTIRQFGYTRFGVEGGAVCVLHTWGQDLGLHPHIHCIVPAVGETLAGNMKHTGSNGKYLFPVRQLSPVFRAKLMESLKRQLKKQALMERYQPLMDQAWEKPWVVFCEPSMAKAGHVVKYLAQYTHRVAITNQRITGISDRGVTFMHKDYAEGARQKPITLGGVEFLRRFCQHILPFRFVKIRRYGIYSSRVRANAGKQEPKMVIPKPKETTQERLKRLTGFDALRCPFCRKGVMQAVEIIPRIRSPSGFYAACQTVRC